MKRREKMKIVFLSNYFNHHQSSLSNSFVKNEDIEYFFVSTEAMSKERKALGYRDLDHSADFVLCAYEGGESERKAFEICDEADVVITGSAPDKFIRKRLKAGKLTFRYSERIFKIIPPKHQMPLRKLECFFKHGRYKNLYMLCASAYTAGDFAKTGNFIGKTYKWGYFPEVKKYDSIEKIIENKKSCSLLWVGRFLDWKHPECAVEVAHRLKQDGYSFDFNIIGTGEEQENIEALIEKYELCDSVHLLGSMKPDEVRTYMEQSQIYLFTSDRQEGWGAVLNESMNSGCAVVASRAIGSVPFLLQNGQNGFVYKDGDIEDLYGKVKMLMDDSSLRERFGKNAYETMINEWNAENGANRFIKLAQSILSGEDPQDLFENGVCSKAEIIQE